MRFCPGFGGVSPNSSPFTWSFFCVPTEKKPPGYPPAIPRAPFTFPTPFITRDAARESAVLISSEDENSQLP